jgi:5-hydroxyisourate hydrolase-like protein (transthyretin family)
VIPSINGDVLTREQAGQEHQLTSQMSDENSVICGYVDDIETGDPLANVDVEQNFEESEGNYGWNDTYTDATGFYQLNTAAVEFTLSFSVDDYFSEHTQWMSIGENEIFWYNISLIPTPPETVYFSGFITDNASGEPVDRAHISLYWYDNEGHYWHNQTETISSGYYCLGAIPGETYIYVYYDQYFSYNSEEYYTENNSFIWLNISLIPYPSDCAIICGYITDAELGDPIPNADVSLYCNTENGQWYNNTIANAIGFYSVGSIQGTIHLHAFRQDYESTQMYILDVNENDTLWVNLTMNYKPTETSLVQGYVVDNETSSVVRNAFVRFDWKDEIGHFYSKYTFTDQKGYYWIKAPEGTIQFLITANGYTNQQTPWFDIDGYTERWLNTSLSPEITLMFSKPQPGIYINNELRFPILSKVLSRFFPKSKPLIIGPLEITVNITKSTMGCDRVEFYIDNTYRWTDSQAPFTYDWNQKGFFNHVIRVIAYDNAGPCTIETITVRKIL